MSIFGKKPNDTQKAAHEAIKRFSAPINQGFDEYVVDPLNKLIPGMWGNNLKAAVNFIPETSPGADVRDMMEGSRELTRGLFGRNANRALNGASLMGLGILGLAPGVGDAAKAGIKRADEAVGRVSRIYNLNRKQSEHLKTLVGAKNVSWQDAEKIMLNNVDSFRELQKVKRIPLNIHHTQWDRVAGKRSLKALERELNAAGLKHVGEPSVARTGTTYLKFENPKTGNIVDLRIADHPSAAGKWSWDNRTDNYTVPDVEISKSSSKEDIVKAVQEIKRLLSN